MFCVKQTYDLRVMNDSFIYSDERFADVQMLRYRLNGFEELTLRQKEYVY